jgi:ABC-2 type transport system permease protein
MEMQTALTYKANAALYLTYVMIPPLAIFFLWKTVLGEGESLQTYDLRTMVSYYIITQFFATNTPFSAWSEIGEGIRSGQLSLWLLRPVSHYNLYLARLLGSWTLLWAMSLGGVTIMAMILHNYFQLQTNPLVLVATVIFWMGGVVLGFTYGYVLNLVAFWTERVAGTLQLSYSAAFFLSGAIIPLDLLPLKEVWLFLPFRYSGFVPAQVYLGRLSPSDWPTELLKLVLWIAISLIIAKLMWRQGLRRYQAAGG